jgi:uncharacterized membrane protein
MDTINFDAIVNSAQDGQWLLFAGLLLTMIVQVVRSLLPAITKKVPKRALPWIIVVVGVLAAGGGVLAGGGSWQAAVIAGVTVGLASLGTYDLVKGPAERVRGNPSPTEPEPEPEPAAEPKAEETKP